MVTPRPEIDIRDFRVFPSMEPTRVGRKDVLITYFLGAEGPFTVTIPYEEIEGKPEATQLDIIRRHIEREQAERMRFVGRKISL
jgi:hypothetical protein